MAPGGIHRSSPKKTHQDNEQRSALARRFNARKRIARQQARRRRRRKTPAQSDISLIRRTLTGLLHQIKTAEERKTLTPAECAQARLALHRLYTESIGPLFSNPEEKKQWRRAKGGNLTDSETEKAVREWTVNHLAHFKSYLRQARPNTG